MKTDLNAEQAEALSLDDGAVVAGAGAGKTRTMVAKIVHDQANGIYPRNQIVVTFTNAAALEMEARLTKAGGIRPRHIGTLHSLALRSITKAWGKAPQVIKDKGYDAIIKAALTQFRIKVPLSTAREWILNPPKAGNGLALRKAVLADMKSQRIIHPDVMITAFLDLTRTNPEENDVRLYVDEAQDGSAIDFAIYSNLAKSGRNRGSIILFGDPRQSIYIFRGADPLLFWNAIRNYGDGVVNLSKNFRSAAGIVQEANRIGGMMNFHASLVTPMEAVKPSTGGDVLYRGSFPHEGFPTTEMEAMSLAETIRVALDHGQSVAVLARYNSVVDAVAQILRGEGLAVETPGRTAEEAPGLNELRNLEELPDVPWSRRLMELGVPFYLHDHLAKMLVDVKSVLEIGPIVDEATGRPTNKKSVWVSTIHGAKGLEWDHVHLVGADSLSFDPGDPEDIRLAYVAVTRAVSNFTVSFARSRAATRRVHDLSPSPILLP